MTLQGLLMIATFAVALCAWGYVLYRTATFREPSGAAMLGIISTPLVPALIGLGMSIAGVDVLFTTQSV